MIRERCHTAWRTRLSFPGVSNRLFRSLHLFNRSTSQNSGIFISEHVLLENYILITYLPAINMEFSFLKYDDVYCKEVVQIRHVAFPVKLLSFQLPSCPCVFIFQADSCINNSWTSIYLNTIPRASRLKWANEKKKKIGEEPRWPLHPTCLRTLPQLIIFDTDTKISVCGISIRCHLAHLEFTKQKLS